MSPGCVYTYSYWRLVAIGVPLHQWCLLGVDMAYIHHRRGACVARFDLQGNSQGPQNVKRATVQGFTLFYVLIVNLITNIVGRRSPRSHNGK